MSGRLYVGIDLGGTKIHGAIAGEDGGILAESRVPTVGDVVDRIAELERSLADTVGAPSDAVSSTVVGGAGASADSEGFALHSNLDLDDSTSFGADLARSLGHPVLLENDVNVAAIGELHYGAGLVYDDFVVVASGTGVGMGIVSERRLVRGARGAAGEIGFLPLGTDPFSPRNQRRGPLEEALAGDALESRFTARTGRRLSPAQLFDAADTDAQAAAEIAEHARWLALGLISVRAVLDPAAVVLMGGIGSRPELLEPLRHELEALGAGDFAVAPSTISDRAPVLGALHLARDAANAHKEGSLR